MFRLLLTVSLCGLALCGKKKDESAQALVRVGGHTYTRGEFGDYSSMAAYFPLRNPQVFPAFRKGVTAMFETDLLYAKAPGAVRRRAGRQSADWKWLVRYYQGQLYMSNILRRNLGFSDKEIEAYYQAHKEDSFKTVVKVPVAPPKADSAAASADSTAPAIAKADTAKAAPAMRDSVAYRSLAEVRERIIKQLFLAAYPPDTSYTHQFFGDSIPDSSIVREQWYKRMSNYIRQRDQDFFLNRYYRQYYGADLPDSAHLWLGDGKVVTPADVALVTGWLPESERPRFESERGQNELGRWVPRWKIYARKAQETGYARTREVRKSIVWAWKYHVMNRYLDGVLLPKLRAGVTIDTALCTFSCWDDRNAVTIPPDSAALAQEIQAKLNRAVGIRLDSVICAIRTRKGVTFLQSDFRDDKDQPPNVILARADSLRDTGNTSQAEQEYRKLTTDYPFTTEGAASFSEIAKLLTERQSYRDAIRNYRLQLFHTTDSSRMCNTYFMIGFIYDEYLNMPELAEVNYKWVLKNMPGCELADDAEFMMLHLDEPMIRIEDLRAEALRQGRKVIYDDEEPLDSIPAPADSAKTASST